MAGVGGGRASIPVGKGDGGGKLQRGRQSEQETRDVSNGGRRLVSVAHPRVPKLRSKKLAVESTHLEITLAPGSRQ